MGCRLNTDSKLQEGLQIGVDGCPNSVATAPLRTGASGGGDYVINDVGNPRNPFFGSRRAALSFSKLPPPNDSASNKTNVSVLYRYKLIKVCILQYLFCVESKHEIQALSANHRAGSVLKIQVTAAIVRAAA